MCLSSKKVVIKFELTKFEKGSDKVLIKPTHSKCHFESYKFISTFSLPIHFRFKLCTLNNLELLHHLIKDYMFLCILIRFSIFPQFFRFAQLLVILAILVLVSSAPAPFSSPDGDPASSPDGAPNPDSFPDSSPYWYGSSGRRGNSRRTHFPGGCFGRAPCPG
jgi:hypothetical protein